MPHWPVSLSHVYNEPKWHCYATTPVILLIICDNLGEGDQLICVCVCVCVCMCVCIHTHYRQRHLFVLDISGYTFRHKLCATTKSLHVLKSELLLLLQHVVRNKKALTENEWNTKVTGHNGLGYHNWQWSRCWRGLWRRRYKGIRCLYRLHRKVEATRRSGKLVAVYKAYGIRTQIIKYKKTTRWKLAAAEITNLTWLISSFLNIPV
jgi:hypothetical protein